MHVACSSTWQFVSSYLFKISDKRPLTRNKDELKKILYGVLPPFSSVGLHTHETSSEIIYILKGEGGNYL